MLKKLLKTLFQGNTRTSIALIMLGTIIWSLTVVKSGLVYPFGMGFWGPNGHDGVWHIALIKSLARGSWDMPVFAGEVLKNYHLGFDLLVAWLHKLTFIPVHTLYFQIIPPLLALFIGIFAYKFVYTWRRSKTQALWATFFVYFGGSFGWIVTLLRSGEIGGESLFWSQQSISTLVNPPFALSIFLMFLGLTLLIKGLRYKNKKLLMFASFIFGILIQIKVYAGVLALGGLFVAGVWKMLNRKGIALMKVATGALIVSILLFYPLSKSATSTVVFKPFWFLETMMGLNDRFYWPRFYSAMVNYRLANNWIKAVPAYLVAFAIFWFGNLGTRVIKEILIIKWAKNIEKITYIDVFFASVIVAGVVFPMFFLQAGTPWNTIQFIYYSLMFSGILAGVTLGKFVEELGLKVRKVNKNPRVSVEIHPKGGLGWHPGGTVIIGVLLLVVLLTVPTTIGTLKHYLPTRPPAKLSPAELEALKFLSEQPDGVVLTYPFDRAAAEAAVDKPPRPLYLYESTAYVSAFSDKFVYLEDEVNLDITGYDWRVRRKKVQDFLLSLDQGEVRSFLQDNNISYIYWLKAPAPDSAGRRVPNGTRQRATLGESQLGIERIFENSEVDIFKVEH